MAQVEIYESTAFSEAIAVLNNAKMQIDEECNRGISQAQNMLCECEHELANSQMLLQEAIVEEARCLAEVHRREAELASALAMYPPDPPYIAYCTEMLALAEAEYQKAIAHRMLMEQRVALVVQATSMAGEMVSTLTMRFNYGMAQAENITIAGCNRLQSAYNDVVKYESQQKGMSNGQSDGTSRKNDPTDPNNWKPLNDRQRQKLKKLGMSDSVINNCTVGPDGKYHLKTRNCDLEGKRHPETGVEYVRRTVNINGVEVEGVFPKFDSKFTCKLPDELICATDPKQFNECQRQLAEQIRNDSELQKQFSNRQLEQIVNGDKISNCTWHHNEELGVMELVDSIQHQKTNHTGGKSIWGGGNDNR